MKTEKENLGDSSWSYTAIQLEDSITNEKYLCVLWNTFFSQKKFDSKEKIK